MNSSVCDQVCTNSAGSYTCSCEPGYKLNADNQCIGEYTCIFVCLHFGTCLWTDVNECLTTNDCQQQCTNIQGGYNCSCSQGFTLNSDNKTCDGTHVDKYYCQFWSFNVFIQLFKSVLLIMAVLMVVLLLTALNNVSVLQDILSTLNNALVCKLARMNNYVSLIMHRYWWMFYV